MRQVGEWDELLSTLERHASQDSVPQNLAIAVSPCNVFMSGARARSIGHQRR